MADIPTIAASLSDAQRRAVLSGRAPEGAGMWAARNALTRKLLFTGLGGQILTPLGIQVRSYLMDQTTKQEQG